MTRKMTRKIELTYHVEKLAEIWQISSTYEFQ